MIEVLYGLKFSKEKKYRLIKKNSPDASELSMIFDQYHVSISPLIGKRFGVKR